jgi:hypothetical protein
MIWKSKAFAWLEDPLVRALDEMRKSFDTTGQRLSSLINSIVVSPQFRNQRNPEYLTQRETRKGD